jgi:hypothetical protein
MSASALLSAFNNQLTNLSTAVIERFPHLGELRMAHSAILMLKNVNPKLLIEIFLNYCYKYRTNIEERNETFFLNTDFISEIDIIEKSQESFEFMGVLRKHWSELDATEKDSIWTYFAVLLRLSEKYIVASQARA